MDVINKASEASVKFTRVVLKYIMSEWPDVPTEEVAEFMDYATEMGLMEKFDTPDHPDGFDWMYRLTELGKQVMA